MCCERHGAKVENKEQTLTVCPECGEECVYYPMDNSFCSTDICGYSPTECEFCSYAPCDQSC